MWFAAMIALITSIFVFFISFWPPLDLPKESQVFFVSFLIIGIIVITSIPLIIYHFKNSRKK